VVTVADGSARAVGYAHKLGFQTAYDEAVTAESIIAEAHGEVLKANRNKRELADGILDRQADLAVEERGRLSELSATAFDAHMKVAIRNDGRLIELRAELSNASYQGEKAEQRAREAELTIRNRTARMMELGGYFQYLAATALLQANNTTSQENSS
jgi:hypothetical protein